MVNNISKIFATFAVISFFITTNLIAQAIKETSDEKIPIIPKVTKIDEVTIKELLKPNGKPLLINFWATWCVPCREEFPELVKLDAEYKGKIDFITITLDDLAEINRDVPKFLNEMKATMPAYLLKTPDENEVIGSISKDWAGGLPFTVLYNEKGDISHTRQGKIRVDIVKPIIDDLLKNKSEASIIPTGQILELPKNDSFFPSDKYSYNKGIEDAKNDVANGKFMILRYGLTPGIAQDARNKLKEKYNIAYKDYGCIVTANLIEYIKGYNEVSRAEIKRKFNLDF